VISNEQEKVDTGYKVYSIAPGVVDTKMQENIRETNHDDFSNLAKFLNMKNENVLYQPIDVAKKLIQLIQHPEEIEDVSYRIVLQ
jgi:benzil reductase ((S)-benzoin forming)